jgi:TolA-binding protein
MAAWLFGGDDDQLKHAETIGSLDDRQVELPAVDPVTVDTHAALEQYRRYLELPEGDHETRAEATRRLGDLNLELGEAQLSEAEITGSSTLYHADAINLYEQLLKRPQKNTQVDRVLYQLARAYESTGENDKALATLDQLVKDYPDSSVLDEAQFRRGEMLFMRKAWSDAAGAYSAVVRAGSGSSFYQQSLYKFGWAQFKIADYDRSNAAFLTLLDMRLTGSDAAALAAQLDAMSRPDRELVDDTLRVLSLTYSYLDGGATLAAQLDARETTVYSYLLYASLGELYLEKERYLDAAATFAAFVEQEPTHLNAPALSMQAIAAYREGRFPSLVLEAKQDFVNAYGLDSDYWVFHDPAQRVDVIEPLKQNLSDLAQYDHAQAQKTKSPEAYARAADWYRRYLNYFPDDPDSAQRSFLLGEILSESQLFDQATDAYLNAAYRYPGFAKAPEAGYAALLAAREHGRTLAGQAAAEWQAQTVDQALTFARSFPQHEHASAVLTNTADELYAAGNTDRAIAVAEEALALEPPLNRELQQVAWTVVAHGEFDRNDFVKAESAYVRLRAVGGSAGMTPAELEERIAATIYKQAESAQLAADVDAAVMHFLRIEQAAPAAAIRSAAVYDAAALLVRAQRWDEAIPVLQRFRSSFPANRLVDDATRNLAIAYEENKQPVLAAGEFEKIAANETFAAAERRVALWHAGELYQQAGDRPREKRIWEQFVTTYPQPVAQAIEARQMLADIAGKDGEGAARRDWLVAIIDADQEAGAQRTDRTKTLAAQASLELANAERRVFNTLKLTIPLADSMRAKKARMESALSAYDRAASYEIAAVTTEATFRIGGIYQQLSADLMGSERPGELNAEELEQYEILLEEQAFPFEEKAIELFEINTARVSKGVYDDWVQQSFAQLAELMPGRYAKYEKAENYVAKLY